MYISKGKKKIQITNICVLGQYQKQNYEKIIASSNKINKTAASLILLEVQLSKNVLQKNNNKILQHEQLQYRYNTILGYQKSTKNIVQDIKNQLRIFESKYWKQIQYHGQYIILAENKNQQKIQRKNIRKFKQNQESRCCFEIV
eukprot:TRINITY_DN924_c0_g1_i1.p2 TRINITY_DN924_c0_g1~~TRINITY_DN924_c0_g1_i1.p2  ORF type:complete len:144 (+),score=3.51 TRINITY_DN924_c0_g1_i1:561-992(+)